MTSALVTSVDVYMGAAIAEKFESLGIQVKTGISTLTIQAQLSELVDSAGDIDILVASLTRPHMTGPVENNLALNPSPVSFSLPLLFPA